MTCLTWSCTGLGNPRTVRQLQDLVSRYKPEIVFLMEVRTSLEKMKRIKYRLNFEGIYFVEGANRGEGYSPFMEEKWYGKITGIF